MTNPSPASEKFHGSTSVSITVKDIQARSEWPGIPPLRGIVESPTFIACCAGRVSAPSAGMSASVAFHATEANRTKLAENPITVVVRMVSRRPARPRYSVGATSP